MAVAKSWFEKFDLKVFYVTVLLFSSFFAFTQTKSTDTISIIEVAPRSFGDNVAVPRFGDEERLEYYTFIMVSKLPEINECNINFSNSHDAFACFTKSIIEEFDKEIKKTKLKKLIKDKDLKYRYFITFFIEANGELTGLNFRTPNKDKEVDLIVTESFKKTIDRLNKTGKIKAAENNKGEKVKMIVSVPYNLKVN